MMKTGVKPIKTNQDYLDALERIESLMDVAEGTPEADELEVLATLVDVYEEKQFPIGLPSPAEAIQFRMEQLELTINDLIPLIGSRDQVSEILSGECELSLEMIRALHEQLGIPAEVLLQRTGILK
jgi:HTH-type transcriptional regulator/antitoxin HigA